MKLKDFMNKTDDELRTTLADMVEPVEWTPVILAELTRRSVESLAVSSRQLEKLTRWLIAWTVVLVVVALPPAIEVLNKLLKWVAAGK